MKAYKVITLSHRGDTHNDIFFSSKSKALGYIIGIMKDQVTIRGLERREDDKWYNANWCYEVDDLFNIRNWNKYEYMLDNGFISLLIEEVEIF